MENIALFARPSCEFRHPRNLKCLIHHILNVTKQKRNLSYCRYYNSDILKYVRSTYKYNKYSGYDIEQICKNKLTISTLDLSLYTGFIG